MIHFLPRSLGTKQTDVLSCLISAQEKEKHDMCMNNHEDCDNIAVMIDSGASDTVAPVEDIVSVGQRYIRVVVKQLQRIQAVFAAAKRVLLL